MVMVKKRKNSIEKNAVKNLLIPKMAIHNKNLNFNYEWPKTCQGLGYFFEASSNTKTQS
jgi:hypothetical protein